MVRPKKLEKTREENIIESPYKSHIAETKFVISFGEFSRQMTAPGPWMVLRYNYLCLLGRWLKNFLIEFAKKIKKTKVFFPIMVN